MEEIIKKIKELPAEAQYSIVAEIVKYNNFSIVNMVALKEQAMYETLEERNKSINILVYKSLSLVFSEIEDKEQLASLKDDLKKELIRLGMPFN